MPILRRFPFVWSPLVEVVVVPPVVPPVWTNVAAAVHAWQVQAAPVLPRFQHIYPQESGGEQQFVRIPAPVRG